MHANDITGYCQNIVYGIQNRFLILGGKLKSKLIEVSRFTGSHTADRICLKFEGVIQDFNLAGRIDYIITDNAANMKKAFNVCLYESTEESLEDEEHDEEEDDAVQSHPDTEIIMSNMEEHLSHIGISKAKFVNGS